MRPWEAPLRTLWVLPQDLSQRDLFNGPWGAEKAPDPHDVYTAIDGGHGDGVMAVRDSQGRTWSVRQTPRDRPAGEGATEVVLSRVLSAAGYHQPPVYFLPSFTLADGRGTRATRGGRFRLEDRSLREVGEWSWHRNPFVGMRPYQGLLVILLMADGADLEQSHNTLYEHRRGDFVDQWYVVRDLGTASHERPFILGVRDGFVRFGYHGDYQELLRDRITREDVGFAAEMLAQITDAQWRDAFRAGGYPPEAAGPFIRKVQANIAQGQQVADGDWSAPEPR
jgi:hypothetical protein